MAVTPMKLVTIVGPLGDFDQVARDCLVNHEFHPEHAGNVMRKVKYLLPFDQTNPYTELLREIESVSDRIGIPLGYHDFGQDEISSGEVSSYMRYTLKTYGEMYEEKERLKKLITENDQILLKIDHLRDMNVELSEFFTFKYVKFRFGFMPGDIYRRFSVVLEEREDIFFFPTSIEKELVYGVYLAPRVAAERADAFMASLQFQRIFISGRVKGTGEEAAERLAGETAKARKRLAELESEIAGFREREGDTFRARYSQIRYMNDSFNLRKYAAHTAESFYILGWVPESEHEGFVALLEQHDVNVVVGSDDSESVTDYSPPTKLRNIWPLNVFEPFVQMYGLPSYNEMDPTPLLALTYTLFFGIMFGDVGQGIVLSALGFLLWKLKKLWLGRVLCCVGFSSAAFGFVYGSVFGNEHLLGGFKVIESPENTSLALTISIYTGVFFISVVIIGNIINGIRQKDTLKKLFGANGLGGLMMYLGLVLLLMPALSFGTAFLPAPLLIVFILLPLGFVFLREPLAKLVDRRKDWKPHEGWGGYIVENLFEMIEIFLSYVTNTLSFLRVGAYAISHASMMSVVYQLAERTNGSHDIVVVIIGNIAVMAIEGLLVAIQVLRLEFYELFSRFYTGGGRDYKPVIIDYKSRNE